MTNARGQRIPTKAWYGEGASKAIVLCRLKEPGTICGATITTIYTFVRHSDAREAILWGIFTEPARTDVRPVSVSNFNPHQDGSARVLIRHAQPSNPETGECFIRAARFLGGASTGWVSL